MIEIKGKVVDLKSVIEADAKFILELRQNLDLNKFISSTSSNLENQRSWIKSYLIREKEKKEFYFIIKDKNSNSCGTVRIYGIDNEKKECTWGSFMLNKNRPDGASYETINLSLKYAFDILNMKKIFLGVHKENKKAIYIYEKVGFKRISQDLENYYYIIEKIEIN